MSDLNLNAFLSSLTDEQRAQALALLAPTRPSRTIAKPDLPSGFRTVDDLPSVFHTNNQAKVLTSAYTHINTATILRSLEDEGWLPYYGKGSHAYVQRRNVNGLASGRSEDTGKHSVCLRHVDFNKELVKGDTIGQIHISNAHDGLGKIKFMGGTWCLWCSNGAMRMDSGYSIGMKHRNLNIDDIVNVFLSLSRNLASLMDRVDLLKSVSLTYKQQIELARRALPARGWEDKEVNLDRLIRPEFHQQESATLWNTFQNIQRAFMGNAIINVDKRKVKELKRFEAIAKVNDGLWQVVEGFAQAEHNIVFDAPVTIDVPSVLVD